MSTVGGYLEYRGGVQYRGGYHDKCPCCLGWEYHVTSFPRFEGNFCID